MRSLLQRNTKPENKHSGSNTKPGRTIMKKIKYAILTVGSLLLLGGTLRAPAVQTSLALRDEGPQTIHTGLTAQLLDPAFGTNLETLAFTGTTTYDFYSPPLSSAISLLTSDKGGGVIYMRNIAATSSNDFSVTGDMQFFDYDPATGMQTLIVDTTASPAKSVNHGQTVNWAIPNALLPTNMTIPAGHMVHIAMTIGLVSGQPGNYGQVIYNGPTGPSTSGLLPQNRSTVLNWTFGPPADPRPLTIFPQSNGQMVLGCYGPAQTACSIQATTSLAAPAWVTLVKTNTDAHGLLNFVDQDATNYPCRYYRAASQ